MEWLGAEIQNRRKARGLRQKELAEQAGISSRALRDAEKGESELLAKNLYGIAKVLEVSVFGLMGLEEVGFEDVERFEQSEKSKKSEKAEVLALAEDWDMVVE